MGLPRDHTKVIEAANANCGTNNDGTGAAPLISERKDIRMITVTWLPHWKAYSVRRNNRIIGMVRFHYATPFRQATELTYL